MDLGAAIGAALKGRRTQAEVAQMLGVSQNTVSRWKTGVNRPTLEEIAAIEAACERPRGFVLRLAGFVDEVVDVLAAVAVDPALSDQGRLIVTTTYRSVVEAGG